MRKKGFGIAVLLSLGIAVLSGCGAESTSQPEAPARAMPAAAETAAEEKAGEAAYLVFGSLLEMTAAVVALGFVLVAGIMIMLLPAVGLIRWLTH